MWGAFHGSVQGFILSKFMLPLSKHGSVWPTYYSADVLVLYEAESSLRSFHFFSDETHEIFVVFFSTNLCFNSLLLTIQFYCLFVPGFVDDMSNRSVIIHFNYFFKLYI